MTSRLTRRPCAERMCCELCSNARIRFQSLFMLITIQPPFFASWCKLRLDSFRKLLTSAPPAVLIWPGQKPSMLSSRQIALALVFAQGVGAHAFYGGVALADPVE